MIRRPLDSPVADAVHVAGCGFVETIQALSRDQISSEPLDANASLGAICTQSLVSGLLTKLLTQGSPEESDATKAILRGSAEGFGLVLGLISDPVARLAAFQLCVTAMSQGMHYNAQIHETQGEA